MTGSLQKRFQKKCPRCGKRFSCEGTCGNKGTIEDYLGCYCPSCYEKNLASTEIRPWRINCSVLTDRGKHIASLALLKNKLEG